MKAETAFIKMMKGICVRITPEGRAFWTKDMILTNIGQWFRIKKVGSDSVDLVGQYHETIRSFPLKYVRE